MTQSTHFLAFTGDRVVKQYRSWDRGEPDREWAGLAVLHQYAPGLSPQPLLRRTDQALARLPERGCGPVQLRSVVQARMERAPRETPALVSEALRMARAWLGSGPGAAPGAQRVLSNADR